MSDFFDSGTMNPNYVSMPGTLGAAAAAQVGMADANASLQNANTQATAVGNQNQQAMQSAALDAQKNQILAAQGNAQNAIAQQQANQQGAALAQALKSQQFDLGVAKRKQALLQAAGQYYNQTGDSAGYIKKLALADPVLAGSVQSNAYKMQNDMLGMEQKEGSIQSQQTANVAAKTKIMAPMVNAMLAADPKDLPTLVKTYNPVLQAAGINLDVDPTTGLPSHSQLIAMQLATQGQTKGLNARAAKLSAMTQEGVGAIDSMNKLLQQGGINLYKTNVNIKGNQLPNVALSSQEQQFRALNANMKDALDSVVGTSGEEGRQLMNAVTINPGDTQETIQMKLQRARAMLTSAGSKADPQFSVGSPESSPQKITSPTPVSSGYFDDLIPKGSQ